MKAYVFVAVLILLATIIGVSTCDNGDTMSKPDVTDDIFQFGYHYYYMMHDIEPPRINDGMLEARIHYSGCSCTGNYELNYETINSRKCYIWLVKLTDSGTCKMLCSEAIKIPLPQEILDFEFIFLLDPRGMEIPLR